MSKKRAGILACEVNRIYSSTGQPVAGHPTIKLGADPTTKGSWGSWQNTEIFLKAWDHIVQEGVYRQTDWTVKIDPDTVFFPDRLKGHVSQRPSRAAYMQNTAGPHPLLGPIEVFSREAVQLYSERGSECGGDWVGRTGED